METQKRKASKIRFLVPSFLLFIFSLSASSEPGRSLPNRSHPLVLRAQYTSYWGSIDVLSNSESSSMTLTTPTGMQCKLQAVIGPDSCGSFAEQNLKELRSNRCVFLFDQEMRSCGQRIEGYHLKQAGLFDTSRKRHRLFAAERRVYAP